MNMNVLVVSDFLYSITIKRGRLQRKICDFDTLLI